MIAEHTALIGRRIKEAREEQGWSQRKLAEAIPGNTGSDQVSKWERGIHRPGDDTLAQIGKALGKSLAWFHTSPADKSNGTPPLMDTLEPDSVEERLAKIEQRQQEVLEAIDVLRADLATRAAAMMKRIDDIDSPIARSRRQRPA